MSNQEILGQYKAQGIKEIKASEIIPHKVNAYIRKQAQEKLNKLRRGIKENGIIMPFLINKQNVLIDGHHRLKVLQEIDPNAVIKAIVYDIEKEEHISLMGTEVNDSYAEYDLMETYNYFKKFDEIKIDEITINGASISLQSAQEEEETPLTYGEAGESSGKMRKDFIYPPFSVLDTRGSEWQENKKKWLGLGIESELGRSADLLAGKKSMYSKISGTSVFDPALCELMISWFSKKEDSVLDPFAGGSVRGVITNKLNRFYTGIELRNEQVEENRKQANAIFPNGEEMQPVWLSGDSNKVLDSFDDYKCDMIFSCPPYADLEVYSDDKADISNMGYDDFLEIYRSIIQKSCKLLNDGGFAVFVIAEIRGKDGIYKNFVSDTIEAFNDAGMGYYNEIILVNSCGTLPLRAGRFFNSKRKVGKHHQNVLVFKKGSIDRLRDVPVKLPEKE